MFQTDPSLLGETLSSMIPRQPDVVLKDIGEKEWPGSAQAAVQSRNHCTQAVWHAKSDHSQPVPDAAGTKSRKMFP